MAIQNKLDNKFTTNQGLGYGETVTCEIIKVEGDDVYGKYISSIGVDEDDINLNTSFSLKLLLLEGNRIMYKSISFTEELLKNSVEFKQHITGRVSLIHNVYFDNIVTNPAYIVLHSDMGKMDNN